MNSEEHELTPKEVYEKIIGGKMTSTDFEQWVAEVIFCAFDDGRAVQAVRGQRGVIAMHPL